jgi:hypothetical protein
LQSSRRCLAQRCNEATTYLAASTTSNDVPWLERLAGEAGAAESNHAAA